MTADELEKNLGTIAHSGSQEFKTENAEHQGDAVDIIGQFGRGLLLRVHGREARAGSEPRVRRGTRRMCGSPTASRATPSSLVSAPATAPT